MVALLLVSLPVLAETYYDPEDGEDTSYGSGAALSDSDLYLYSGIAQWIYHWENPEETVIELSVDQEDLTPAEKAFGTYYYQYHAANDDRIQYLGDEFNRAYILDMHDIMRELFGNVAEEDFQIFETDYVDHREGELYLMNAVGDFGDAGDYFFADPRIIRNTQGIVEIHGDIREYDTVKNDYFTQNQYTAYYQLGEDAYHNWLTFLSLRVGAYDDQEFYDVLARAESGSGSNGYENNGTNGGSDIYGYNGYDGSGDTSGEGETLERLRIMALDYYERHYSYRPGFADVEPLADGSFEIHLYDIIDDGKDGGHTATSAWYQVDYTGYGTDTIFGEEINLMD